MTVRPLPAIALAALAAFAVAPHPAAAVPEATTHVHISGFAYSPSPLTIPEGDLVEWHNHDSATHTASATSGAWATDFLAQGESDTLLFADAGTFPYYCEIHTSMSGSLTVTEPATLPPEVAIATPASGTTVTGDFTVTGTASDPEGALARVDVRIGGGAWIEAVGTSSWTADVDSRTASNGARLVEARSFDGIALSPLAAITVVVDNVNVAPTVAISAPAAGATVAGVVTVAGTASDPVGAVERVDVRVDGGPWAVASGTTSWSLGVSTLALANGPHTIEARSFDGELASPVASVGVVVDNFVDLRPSSMTVAGTAFMQRITVVVANSGTVASGASTLGLLAEDGAGALTRISDRPVASVPPGGTVTVVYDWFPLGKIGRWIVHARVDEPNAVVERNEANNAAAREACVPGGPAAGAMCLVPGRSLA